MTTSPRDDAPNPVKQQEILKSLVTELVRASGEGWQQLEYRVKAVGRYRENRFTAIGPDGSRNNLRPPLESSRAVRSLREVMAVAGAGTWFTAVVHIDDSLQFGADFDYDNEPEWQTEPGAAEFLTEQESYPRSPEHQPSWFKDRLAEAGAASS
jgi:hypothetical protein